MPDNPGDYSSTKRDRQRRRAEERGVAEQHDRRSSQRRSAVWTVAVIAVVALAAAALALRRSASEPSTATQDAESVGAEEGVETYEVTDQSHVEGPVTYAQTPPVGGPHAAAWQNCGAYDTPIANENAVHSMEHGAVWITQAPELAASDVEALRSIAANPYILVSPHPEVAAGVVASAWAKQMTLDSVDTERLNGFVTAFAQGPQTPEPGAPCTGGIGEPVG
ncbi:MAG: DUF3105 domain-containing protein [Nitriliruptorales bacterium]|nr:DUF3105 domain-containing protein [Nitriliruptorales bacterium]